MGLGCVVGRVGLGCCGCWGGGVGEGKGFGNGLGLGVEDVEAVVEGADGAVCC